MAEGIMEEHQDKSNPSLRCIIRRKGASVEAYEHFLNEYWENIHKFIAAY